MKRALLLALGLTVAVPAVQAEDLLTVYERAKTNDPQIREADALRKASSESRPQALAALLPQVSGSYARTKDDTDGTSTSQFVLNGALVPSDRSGKGDATNKRWSIDLRQSVFSSANWVALNRATGGAALYEPEAIATGSPRTAPAE